MAARRVWRCVRVAAATAKTGAPRAEIQVGLCEPRADASSSALALRARGAAVRDLAIRRCVADAARPRHPLAPAATQSGGSLTLKVAEPGLRRRSPRDARAVAAKASASTTSTAARPPAPCRSHARSTPRRRAISSRGRLAVLQRAEPGAGPLPARRRARRGRCRLGPAAASGPIANQVYADVRQATTSTSARCPTASAMPRLPARCRSRRASARAREAHALPRACRRGSLRRPGRPGRGKLQRLLGQP